MRTIDLLKRTIATGILAAATMRASAESLDTNGAKWVRGGCDGLRVGDVVRYEAGSGRWVGVPFGELASRSKSSLPVYLVSDVRDNACLVSCITEDGTPQMTQEDGAVILTAGKRLTMCRDAKAFLQNLPAADKEVTIEQKRNPFRVGDVAALNAKSGYLVRVASGRVQEELRQGTRLYLVTQIPRRNQFLVSRVTGSALDGDTVAANR